MEASGFDSIDSLVSVPMLSPRYSFSSAIESSLSWDWHQLLIIGNGFDLEAGLPSKFSDFFNVRKPLLTERAIDPDFPAGKLGFKLNVWDLILAQQSEADWCDIEKAVAEWIVPKEQTIPGYPRLCPAEELLEIAVDDPREFSDAGMGVGSIKSYIERVNGRKLKHWSSEELYRYLLAELNDLESDFKKYMVDAVNSTEDYLSKARALVTALVEDEWLDDELLNDELRPVDEYCQSTSVLSFNYTTPVDNGFMRCKDGSPIYFTNIHGELEGNIVFGIDGTGLLDNALVLPFTKTYRIMRRGTAASKLVRKADSVNRDRGTEFIKFYGHSLGPADYSYFQAIFDTVDLYGGNTRLIFYYKRFGDYSPEAARADMMDKAIHLLDAYGKTLDNVDHGKNLIHKLVLEGRLLVKDLSD